MAPMVLKAPQAQQPWNKALKRSLIEPAKAGAGRAARSAAAACARFMRSLAGLLGHQALGIKTQRLLGHQHLDPPLEDGHHLEFGIVGKIRRMTKRGPMRIWHHPLLPQCLLDDFFHRGRQALPALDMPTRKECANRLCREESLQKIVDLTSR